MKPEKPVRYKPPPLRIKPPKPARVGEPNTTPINVDDNATEIVFVPTNMSV